MKKISTIIIVVLLLFAYPMTTYAETGIYETAEDLFAAYSIVDCNDPDALVDRNTEYPDAMCGCWVTDSCPDNNYNHYIIAIQNTEEGNALKQRILDLIKDDSTISFVYQKYSYNYLLQIQEKLRHYEKHISMVANYPDVLKNSLHVEILTEKKDDKKTQEILNELSQKYQDAIYFVYVDDYAHLDTYNPNNNDTIGLNSFMPYFLLLCITTILFAFGFLLKQKERNMFVLQTTDKRTVTVSNQLTTKEVEEMIQKSNVPVPQDLEKKIMQSINM